MISAKRHSEGVVFALMLVCTQCTTPTESLFREEAPRQGIYHHINQEPDANSHPITQVEGGHYLFFHRPKTLRTDTANAGSSTSSSEKGKTNTSSDSGPSSTNDSSWKGSDNNNQEGSSTSSSEKGKTNTSSDHGPSSTDDSSWKGGDNKQEGTSTSSSEKGKTNTSSDSGPSSTNDSWKGGNNTDSEEQGKSSGSSSEPGEPNQTSDSKPSSEDDSSMNSDGVGDEEQSESTEDEPTAKSNTCKISNGRFGTLDTGGRGLQFFFQMETISSVNETLVNDVLLPLAETGVAGRLLTLFFSECRNTKRSSLRRRSLQGSAESCEAKGYSNLPVDRVLSGVPCVGDLEDPQNNCFVVDAGARLYFDAGACADAINRSKAEIKKVMDRGAFDDLDRRIIGISYVEESDLELTSTDKTVQSTGGGDSETLPVYAWCLIGVGAFLVLALCGYLCCFARRKRQDEMSLLGARARDSDDDIDYDPPASDHENPYYDSEARQSVTSESVDRTDDSMLPPMEETSGEDTD